MSRLEAVTLAFSGAMTCHRIDAARSAMVEAISYNDLIEVDCSEVTEADIGFVRMLSAARLGASQFGKMVRLATPAEGALRMALERGGYIDPCTPGASFWRGE